MDDAKVIMLEDALPIREKGDRREFRLAELPAITNLLPPRVGEHKGVAQVAIDT